MLPAKPGQKTLASLDEYRYKTAPDTFGAGGSTKLPMGLDDVKALVEWKLYVFGNVLAPTHLIRRPPVG